MIGGVDVSRETLEALQQFEALVLKWTKSINLIAKGTTKDIWDRHIVDSAQVWQRAPQEWQHWVDIGSGGGFPALVLAVIAKEKKPDARFTLIESDQRKGAFLRTAIRELNLSATVLSERIEDTVPQKADVLSARALASLDVLLGYAERHLSSHGTCLFQKGRGAEAEITEAKANWAFSYQLTTSITAPEACLISVEGLTRV